jgi:spermidine synthase
LQSAVGDAGITGSIQKRNKGMNRIELPPDTSCLTEGRKGNSLPPLPFGYFYFVNNDKEASNKESIYIIEISDVFDRYHVKAKSVICSVKSRFQSIIIADTHNYGVCLFLDGVIQSSANDEDLYHEFLVQPAMLLHENPRDVLIIGGGEGATLREVLAHQTVRKAVMVDIDQQAVDLCRQHLLQWHCGAFEDSRVEMHYRDGREFVEVDDRLFDVVIVDVVDLLDNGPAQRLYTRQFYELVRKRLRPGGILVIQGLELSINHWKDHVALRRTLQTVFTNVSSYRVNIPSFFCSWGFLMASDRSDMLETMSVRDIDARISIRLDPEWLDHLNGAFLRSSFCYGKELNLYLSLSGPIVEDDCLYERLPDIEEVDPTWEKLRLTRGRE